MKLNPAQSKGSHWYPTQNQLKDPASTHAALKQVLDQLYALQDRHDKLQTAHTELQSKVAGQQSTDTSGPSTTKLLGLPVAPVDTNTLANGATLKYNKATGNFIFS